MGSLPEENLKITFFTDAPFIVKFRFEKYRYLLTFLLCIQIFEAPLSHSHSTGPQNISAGRLVPLSVACLVWWHSFRPQIYDESKTDQILNAKYFVWNNYTLGKWGSRKAFNQNSLMQLFNGDRAIVMKFYDDHHIIRWWPTYHHIGLISNFIHKHCTMVLSQCKSGSKLERGWCLSLS